MKIGFYEESPGVQSNTRLIITAVVANAIFITDLILLMWLFTTKDIPGTIGPVVGTCLALFSGLTGLAATWKLVQKQMEKSSAFKTSINNSTEGDPPDTPGGGN